MHAAFYLGCYVLLGERIYNCILVSHGQTAIPAQGLELELDNALELDFEWSGHPWTAVEVTVMHTIYLSTVYDQESSYYGLLILCIDYLFSCDTQLHVPFWGHAPPGKCLKNMF